MLKSPRHVAIKEEAINIGGIENDIKDDVVRIPFSKSYLMEQNHLNNSTIVVKAKKGHNLYNYEGFYDYYVGTWFFNGQWECEYEPLELTEEEEEFIKRVVWLCRDKVSVARLQIEEAIKNSFIKKYNLYYENLIGSKYISEWLSLDSISMLVAKVNNIDNGIDSINIEEFLAE